MGRTCIICDKGLTTYIREKQRENRAPKAIMKALKDRYDVDIPYHVLRYHTLHHDPIAGSYVQAKRSSEKKLKEAIEMTEKAAGIVARMQDYFDKIWEMTGELNWEEFKLLPLSKQIQVLTIGQKTMAEYKKVEIMQKRLDMDENPEIENLNKLVSRAKPTVIVRVFKEDGTKEDDEA